MVSVLFTPPAREKALARILHRICLHHMNVNEVIAHLAAERGVSLHPNDQVNASQSSNDTFPSALHIAAVLTIINEVVPAAMLG